MYFGGFGVVENKGGLYTWSMSKANDDAVKQIDEAIDKLKDQLDEVDADDVAERDSEDPEEEKLHDPQITPPAVADNQAVGGSMPDPESDDDVDDIGKEYGAVYEDDEPLQIDKKIPVTTKSEPETSEEEVED